MGLESLIAGLFDKKVTPVTPPKQQALPRNPALPLKVALVTSVTPEKILPEKTRNLPRLIIDWLKPCPLCNGRNFIHGHKGGFFCEVCQPGARPGQAVRAEGKPRKQHAEEEEASPVRSISQSGVNHQYLATAHAWISSHRQALHAAGWTSPELYRRNKSKGIAWMEIWKKPGLEIVINDDGTIAFRFLTATGQSITQIARPQQQNNKEKT